MNILSFYCTSSMINMPHKISFHNSCRRLSPTLRNFRLVLLYDLFRWYLLTFLTNTNIPQKIRFFWEGNSRWQQIIAQRATRGSSPFYLTVSLITEVILTCETSSVKPLLSLMKCVTAGWKEQQRPSPGLPCQSFEALEVLTQSQGLRIWERASPSRAELVRLHRKGHSRAQNWCSYDTMAVVITRFVTRFALPTFTIMIKPISFSMRTYGNGKLWRVWIVKRINMK